MKTLIFVLIAIVLATAAYSREKLWGTPGPDCLWGANCSNDSANSGGVVSSPAGVEGVWDTSVWDTGTWQ